MIKKKTIDQSKEMVISETDLLYIKNSVYDKDILRASPVAQW